MRSLKILSAILTVVVLLVTVCYLLVGVVSGRDISATENRVRASVELTAAVVALREALEEADAWAETDPRVALNSAEQAVETFKRAYEHTAQSYLQDGEHQAFYDEVIRICEDAYLPAMAAITVGSHAELLRAGAEVAELQAVLSHWLEYCFAQVEYLLERVAGNRTATNITMLIMGVFIVLMFIVKLVFILLIKIPREAPMPAYPPIEGQAGP